MNIIINHSSMVPIYEQMTEQIKGMIKNRELVENDVLPSVRVLAKELKISALTVKKAYDILEEEGFTVTVHGKGSYVAKNNAEQLQEEYRKEIEQELEATVEKSKRYGLEKSELRDLFEMIMEEW
ncbi:MAG: GntR family transcriptional regulator [Lachnospiraceae bacterium]|nr:GntR family transcriptional regulator [Lachnospiraceae bacterium]